MDSLLSDNAYVHSTEAFLFSLKNRDNQPYKMRTVDKYPHNAINHASSYGPTFGGGFDLYIADNCDKNINSYSKLGVTYQTPAGYITGAPETHSLLAGSFNFKVDEYEVFYQP